tara:strand:+ start:184 stop:972 length:789 start_codon:yes stop_codon:yes gene_type:complete
MSFNLIKDVLLDSSLDWLKSLPGSNEPLISSQSIDAHLGGVFKNAKTSISDVVSIICELQDEELKESLKTNFDWRLPPHDKNTYPLYVTKKLTQLEHIPVIAHNKTSSKNIGFALPVASFGGVERVAYNVAEEFKSSGCNVHLIVVGEKAKLPDDYAELFKTITFLDIEASTQWEVNQLYNGTGLPVVPYEHSQKAAAALCWLDSLILCHSWQLYPSIASLKSCGVQCFSYQHLNDLSPNGRPLGNPFIALAYEHALNGIIT